MHLLMNLSELSEQELIEKMGITSQRMASARMCNMNSNLIDQMQLLMLSYQEELSNRNQPPVPTEKVAWDMDQYLEDYRNASNTKEEEDIPRWQSAAFDEFDDSGDDEGGGSFLD